MSKKIKHKFEFGENWKYFLREISNHNINYSKKALVKFTKIKSFKNKNFIDIGCGSGLSSLAAMKLGANVLSIDVDVRSIECTKYLKKKYYKNSKKWEIKKVSILNTKKINQLKKFDFVYSWGVLHHTGNLKKSLRNTESLCNKKGLIYLALYNDQGNKSHRWKFVKKFYVKNNIIVKKLVLLLFSPFFLFKPFLKSIFNNKLKLRNRGMSHYFDFIDWIGGYPFEVSKLEKIINFFIKKNYKLLNLKTCGGGHGNNEFLFKKIN